MAVKARAWSALVIGLIVIGGAELARAATGVGTRFDYVAVFPAGTDPARIEAWREQVLGRVHQQACLRERPCIARMLRLAVPGRIEREVIAFDLMQQIPAAEHAAIIAASSKVLPGTTLQADSRPSDIEAGVQPASSP